MQDPASELRRIPLPRTAVNRGKNGKAKGSGAEGPYGIGPRRSVGRARRNGKSVQRSAAYSEDDEQDK